ncbi:DUF6517 family protein [Haloarcula sp. S1CR25-12]|uniref:DUF6517 family protein n=1 Tax=Haloarcula saliterrae TaxID=2950534 RepID=A0ABU2FBK7_9EURY|nr:DUF6517 family protein [Haloarcula sp. S1CR25-12]MDS0259225.1 DUF6517 family protein [Haloarcula sp. S1CR25-12]
MRRSLLTAVVAMLVVASGCIGLVTGETVEFEASNATVEESTLESTGYEENSATERSSTRNVTFVGQERSIRVVNKVTRYGKNGTVEPTTGTESPAATVQNGTVASGPARFVLLSSPGANVAGRTLNPAASWSNERVLEEVADQTGQIGDLEKRGNRTAESLGESRNVSEFTGTTSMVGRDVEVRVHVTSFEHEGDAVIAVAVHPERMDEEATVDEMLGGIEHGGN